MRIIRTDHLCDYYDCLSNPLKDAVVYNRNRKFVTLSKNENWNLGVVTDYESRYCKHSTPYPSPISVINSFSKFEGNHEVRNYYGSFYAYQFALAFCGKTYPGIAVNSYKKNTISGLDEFTGYDVFYDYDSFVDAFSEKNPNWRLSTSFFEKPLFSNPNSISLKQAFTSDALSHVSQLNEMYKSPIVLLAPDINEEQHFGYRHTYTAHAVVDANLKMLQFYKVMNIQQCFQQIEMYVSNVLVSDPMPELKISDKLRAESHGFNKESFRKQKSKNK